MALITQGAPSFSSSSSFSITPSIYDVFLSFRGKDTRNGFTDHLHTALKQRGFIVFKDDEKLKQGSTIAIELLKAIKESRYAVIVISETFAFSKWCLKELSTIMECRKTEYKKTGVEVLPIFYHVDPSNVRKQEGVFAQAFHKHNGDPKVYEEEREAWKAALKEVGGISGWHVDGSSEATVVQQITGRIFRELCLNSPEIFKNFVGLESRVETLVSLLHLEKNDVRYIGIHGMGGIGKTTLAKALYDIVRERICGEFDASSFIHGGNGSQSIYKLQQQIIKEVLGEREMEIWNSYQGIDVLRKTLCNKKVFIILDDVNWDQLEGLAKNSNWFGKGSRIIITGRDCWFWKSIVSDIYEVEPLEVEDALLLFCQKAFKKSYPEKSFAELSMAIIRLVGGLPLALEVIGSFLYGMEIDVWSSALHVLEPKFLGTDAIEGIVTSSDLLEHESLSFEAFSRMRRLKVFIIKSYDSPYLIKWVGNPSKLILSNELRIMKWPNFPLKSLPTSFQPDNLVQLFMRYSKIEVLQLGKKTFDRLKCINLHGSQSLTEITDLSGVPNLEKLCLNNCCHLRKIHPSLGTLQKLLILKLKFCTNLKRLPEKVCWKSLQELNLTSCSKLENVPENMGDVTSLRSLQLGSTCIKVPLSEMKSLLSLRNLDISDGHGKTLLHHFCQFVDSHSHIISHLYWLSNLNLLKELDLSYRNLLDEEIPNISCLSSLEILNLSANKFTKVPEGICQLPRLRQLYLSECKHLQSLSTSLPLGFSILSSLKLNSCNLLDETILNGFGLLSSVGCLELCKNEFMTLPDCFYLFSNLRRLQLCNCSQLWTLPKLPLGLDALEIENCPSLERGCFHTGFGTLQLCSSQWFSVAMNTCHEYDGKPYKILQLNPQHILNKTEFYEFCDGNMFAWGPTLRSEIPEWFNHSSTNCSRVDVDSEELIEGFALFVAYQVHEDENSNGSILGGSNPTFPEFVWRFQASDICRELPLVFCMPEVPLVGRNGFWAYVPVELFKKNGMDLDRCRYLETSIGTSSSDVEVKECGIRLLHRDDSSEFFELLGRITPPGLNLKGSWDFDLWFIAGVDD